MNWWTRRYSKEAKLVLDEWQCAHPEDKTLVNKLTVSGLSSPLKAEKRTKLAGKLSEVAEIRVDTELKVGRVIEQEAETRNGQ